MRRVFDAVKRVSESAATVMIRGESGTGKELIARAIHFSSRRSQQPFISVNCAALPETLIESELFGHERGAFTGAVATHTGRFELAHGGTLFLDEIGSISPAVQSKLLRVLEERRFERVGGTRKIQTDVRLITATNEDLEKKVTDGEFREDLYYRIKVFPIFVPPLRERREDIPLLLDHLLRVYCKDNHLPLKMLDAAALEAMMVYPWKGNVRELENLVQTLVLMTDSQTITAQDLPSYIWGEQPPVSAVSKASIGKDMNFDQLVEQFECEMIQNALRQTNGVRTRAAKLLGLDKNRMKYLCRKYRI
jgi:transcriptional regulator with GAF, ATPase, and Fis domain